MTFEAWRIQGWATLPAETAEEHLSGPRARKLGSVKAALWVQAAPESEMTVVRVRVTHPSRVEIIPGSQGLDLRCFESSAALAVELSPSENLIVDARLWLRLGDTETAEADLLVIEDTVAPAWPATEELARWCSRGYAFIRGGIDAEIVDALSAAIDRALADDVAAWGEEALRAAGQFGALRNLSDLDPVFIALLDSNTAYRLIDQLLRPDYVLQAYDGLVMAPGDSRYPWDFHTDLEPLNGVKLPRHRTLAVNVLYYLDRTTIENGATWIVPHSHLCTLDAPDPSSLAALAVPAVGDAGDILLFDSQLWHCAGCNNSSSQRRLIKTLFCEPWIRPALDYRRALAPSKRANLPDKVKTLLGEQATPPTNVSDFRRLAMQRRLE